MILSRKLLLIQWFLNFSYIFVPIKIYFPLKFLQDLQDTSRCTQTRLTGSTPPSGKWSTAWSDRKWPAGTAGSPAPARSPGGRRRLQYPASRNRMQETAVRVGFTTDFSIEKCVAQYLRTMSAGWNDSGCLKEDLSVALYWNKKSWWVPIFWSRSKYYNQCF